MPRLLPRLAVAVLAVAAIPTSSALADASSDFATSADGWTLDKYDIQSETFSAAGDPAWSAGAIEADPETTAQLYFSAPAKFLGDWTGYVGGTLNFQLKANPTGHPHVMDVCVQSNVSTYAMCRNLPDAPVATAFKGYSVPITSTGWTHAYTGAPITQSEFNSRMYGVTRVAIRGTNSTTGSESGWLDNVLLAAAPKSADVAVSAKAASTKVEVGKDITYTVKVTNAGPDTAKDVFLYSEKESHSTYVSGRSGCYLGEGQYAGVLHCPLGDIPSGGNVEFQVVYRAAAVAPDAMRTFITDAASPDDPSTANNEATVGATFTAAEQKTTTTPTNTTTTPTNSTTTTTSGGGSGGTVQKTAPATPPPAPLSVLRDQTPPTGVVGRIASAARVAAALNRGFSAQLTPKEDGAALAQITASGAGPRAVAAKVTVLGSLTKPVKAGVPVKLTVKLNKKGKARVRRTRRALRLTLVISLVDKAGNSAVVKRQAITVKR